MYCLRMTANVSLIYNNEFKIEMIHSTKIKSPFLMNSFFFYMFAFYRKVLMSYNLGGNKEQSSGKSIRHQSSMQPKKLDLEVYYTLVRGDHNIRAT